MRTILLILLGTYANQIEYRLDHIPHFDIQCKNIWYDFHLPLLHHALASIQTFLHNIFP
jgi:hypothetical protein